VIPRARLVRCLIFVDLPCLLAAAAAWCLVPSGHAGSPLLIAATMATFVAGSAIGVRLATGVATAVQPAFILALFTLPLNTVPAAAIVVVLVGDAINRRPPRELVLAVGDACFALGPVLIIAATSSAEPSWSQWPFYVAALAAQVLCEASVQPIRRRLLGMGARNDRSLTALPIAVDVLLSPAGLAAAVAVHDGAAIGALSLMWGVLGLAAWVARERSRRLKFEHRALHDPLTGLPNRVHLAALLDDGGGRRPGGDQGAVLVIDLDDFKAINDSHGHQRGDAVLCAVADRLRSCVRVGDTVGRVGGDEFVVVLGGACTLADAERVADTVRRRFDAPLQLAGGPMSVTVSVGAAPLAGHAASADALALADQAMYDDKLHGQARRRAA
jgi:diguanylate cyclase (GGDEF)-like protein